ncbi:MAG: alpha/beta hydrolase [Woeseiaceae bacterium]|nr:alpha/beta hydrolase [Woeseiaceae bacterium]
MDVLLYLVLGGIIVWLLARIFLRGADHSQFDQPKVANVSDTPSPEHAELERRLNDLTAQLQSVSFRERNNLLRELMDAGLLGGTVDPAALGVTTDIVDAGGVPGEWVLVPGADPDRRLLYLHGGGFFAGSPASARSLTAGLSRRAGIAVLSLDYRLMPENGRHDSVADTEAAYQWLLENGPEGAAPAKEVFVAGDSAGGNLALVVSASARDNGWRQPDGVVAFSPSTDSTVAAPSYRSNIATDPVLGPPLGGFAKLPATIRVVLGFLMGKVNPAGTRSSPLFGNLAGLSPTLVQAADCEMLIDDARRYVNKARSQGTRAELQSWSGTVHVFQMFGHIIPEADQALDKAAEFLGDPQSLGQSG